MKCRNGILENIILFIKSKTQVMHWNEFDFEIWEGQKTYGIENTS